MTAEDLRNRYREVVLAWDGAQADPGRANRLFDRLHDLSKQMRQSDEGADPAVLLTRRWDDGESLLYAANEAAEDEIETKFSYETRANEQHWTPVEFDPTAHQMPIVAVLLSDPPTRHPPRRRHMGLPLVARQMTPATSSRSTPTSMRQVRDRPAALRAHASGHLAERDGRGDEWHVEPYVEH